MEVVNGNRVVARGKGGARDRVVLMTQWLERIVNPSMLFGKSSDYKSVW